MRLSSSSIGVAVSIVLGSMVPVGLQVSTAIAETVQQTTAKPSTPQTGEIDAAIAEGKRLLKEGSAESQRNAIIQFEKALELAQIAKLPDKQALILLALGFISNNLGEKQKALDYYNQALPIDRAIDNRIGEAIILNNIGSVYSDLGEKQKALDYYNQALLLYRAIDSRIGEATILNNIGSVYSDLSEKQKALDYYKQSLSIYQALKNRSGEATVLNNIGKVYDDLGEKQKALDYYNQALPIYRTIGNRYGEAIILSNIGSVYNALGETKKALKYYNQALPVTRTIGARSDEAKILGNIGRIYDVLGEKQKALDYYNQALPITRSVGDRAGEATILNNIGGVYSALGDKQKALNYFNQALPICQAIRNRYGEATTLNNIGSVYNALGKKQTALDYYKQALPIHQAIRNRSGEASTLNNIGLVYDTLGEKQKALDYYNKALPIRRAIGDRSGESVTLNNIGGVYNALGDKQKALDYYNQALPIAQAIGDRSNEATILSNIGSVYDDLGEKQKALDYFNQALPIRRDIGDRSGEASTLNNIGLVYDTLGEKQKALDCYNQALPITRSIGDRSNEAKILNNTGAIYDDLGEKQKALNYYNQALLIRRTVGDRSGEATTLNNIGFVYNDLGEKQKALDYYNQALLITREIGDRSGEATILSNIGSVYDDLGDKQKALDYYNQALPIRRIVRDRSGEAITLNNIALTLVSQKQPELAIAVYKQSVNVYESIRKDNQGLSRELRESYTKSIAHTYQDLANLLIKQGRLPEAQAVLELLQLKELRDYTRDAKLPSFGISFTPAEQKALNDIFSIYGTAANFAQQLTQCIETHCPNLTQLQHQRDQVNSAIRDMLDRLRASLKDQFIDISKLNTSEFNQAAKAIVNAQDGTLFIYPVVTETKLQFLLAVKSAPGDNAPVVFRAVDGPSVNSEDLFTASNQLRNALRNRDSDLKALQATSYKLYQWLIKPLEPEITNAHIKHLVFASDRVIRNIPLAALYDGQEYLAQKPYTLATVLAASATDPTAPRPLHPAVLAVGASTFRDAPALNYVEQETSAIVRTPHNQQGIFPGDRYLNGQFTFQTLEDKLSGHTILHIATHGVLDPVNIDNSYLLTSDGSKITKTDINQLHDYGLDNLYLVILSACNTATGGKNSDNLEIGGISYYFMRDGGAKSVIASLWQVNDPATALMMQQFYRYLAQGKTKAEALQQVQRDFITEKLTLKNVKDIDRAGGRRYIEGQPAPDSFAHPYYWAPFILIGNGL